jgi:hypothetical protein
MFWLRDRLHLCAGTTQWDQKQKVAFWFGGRRRESSGRGGGSRPCADTPLRWVPNVYPALARQSLQDIGVHEENCQPLRWPDIRQCVQILCTAYIQAFRRYCCQ